MLHFPVKILFSMNVSLRVSLVARTRDFYKSHSLLEVVAPPPLGVQTSFNGFLMENLTLINIYKPDFCIRINIWADMGEKPDLGG